MKLLNKLIAILVILLFNNIYAQNHPIAVCGTDELQEDIFAKNPGLKEVYENKLREFRAKRANNQLESRTQNEVLDIPIVVHVLDPKNNITMPTDIEIINWIERANVVFSGEANDILGPNQGGTMLPIRLVLAKRTPQCTTTTGINRIDMSSNSSYVNSGVANGNQPGVPYSTINNTYNWDSGSYFNIYVTHMINGRNETSGGSFTAGFATYPGYNVDLSVMLNFCVRDVDDTTFAHEMMHAFGVKHVFAADSGQDDGTGSTCGGLINDGIDDTQRTRSGLYFGYTGNPYNQYTTYPTNNTINDCTGTYFDGEQHNMMNYGSRLDRFTPGQGQYAMDVIYEMRPGLLLSKGGDPIDGNTASEASITATCNPSGLLYLPSSIGSGYQIGIERFLLGRINSISDTPRGGTGIFYTDYTTKNCSTEAYSTELLVGETYQVTAGTSAQNNINYTIYIDFNNNGTFETNENLNLNLNLISSLNWNYESVSANYTVPDNVLRNVPLRMRVIGDINGSSILPCGNRFYGEVEDYTVIFKDPNISNDTTIWTGSSWSNGIPNADKNAIVRGNLVQTSNLTAKSLKIDAGSLTLNDGVVLKVINGITNLLTADKFIVNNGANIVQTTTTANVGNATVKKKSTPMVFNDATLWASPVTNQNVRNFSPNTLLKRFYEYNETTNGFAGLFVYDANYPPINNLYDPLAYNFIPGKGYHIRVSNNHTSNEPGANFEGSFVGRLNNGSYSVPVTKNGRGYNLVGNPYPSNIDGRQILLNNTSISSLHYWTHEASLGSDGYRHNNYASYNIVGGVQAVAGGNTPNQFIQKGQGFLVQAIQNTSVEFTNSLRVEHNNGIFFRTEDESRRIWLDLFEENEPKNQVLIGYVPDATNGFDHQMDAHLNVSFNGSLMYSMIENDNSKYVIQGKGLPFENTDITKIGFKSSTESNYTIKLNNSENFEDIETIYLKDNFENQYVNLKETDYNFTSTIGEFINRFEIHFTDQLLQVGDLNSKLLNVYTKGNKLFIEADKKILKVELFDNLGRKISSVQPDSNIASLTKTNNSKQVLVLIITLEDQSVVTRKIIF